MTFLCVVVVSASRAMAVSIICLYLWTILPIFAGWTSSVVMTGSMRPSISPGDIVLTDTARSAAAVEPGDVLRFTDPADRTRNLLHRVVHTNADGSYTTKGDANALPDSAPVWAADISGRARLRVPGLGLPVLWLRTGQYLPLGAAFLAAVTLFWTAVYLRPSTQAASPV